ncbi:hypothetical protein [Escherichia coli]|uniref:hypothetical protein n=1 Tax=Escherichia coli TaxID=562 RepID=UPI00092DE51D|nr:hypothetical protein [Escherichia coli]APL04469.1 hypothetical protein RG56_14665 [Escherichia coli]APL14253.1 hypothetical protein RG58_14650 [Escherichia coli]APL21504.1 hypothetical protein RG60_01260 [Escherichia coli]APL27231.1 hypothetical protein RG61_05170 [Escherichia coli]APL36356.1 hypothetical protein RG63_01230 [Escherichia coli]
MIIDLDTLFPVRKTFTDIVSYCTDPFASVESKVFASLPADVECGDLITSTGAKYESGDDIYVVMSEFVTADSNKTVNVLRANAGLVCIKADALNAEGAVKEAAIAALAAKGFQLEGFNTVFTS